MSSQDFNRGYDAAKAVSGLFPRSSANEARQNRELSDLSNQVEAAQREVQTIAEQARELAEQNRQLLAEVNGLQVLREALKKALAEVAPDHPLSPTAPGSDGRRQAIFERGWDEFFTAERNQLEQMQNKRAAVEAAATNAPPPANPFR